MGYNMVFYPIFKYKYTNIEENGIAIYVCAKEVFSMADAYCVRCRKKVQMKNEQQITTKNKRKALKGKCPNCDTTVMKFIK